MSGELVLNNIGELTSRFRTFHDAVIDRIEFDYLENKGNYDTSVHILLRAYDYRFLDHNQFPQQSFHVELNLDGVSEFNLRGGNWAYKLIFEMHFLKVDNDNYVLTDADNVDDKEHLESDTLYFKFKELYWEAKR